MLKKTNRIHSLRPCNYTAEVHRASKPSNIICPQKFLNLQRINQEI